MTIHYHKQKGIDGIKLMGRFVFMAVLVLLTAASVHAHEHGGRRWWQSPDVVRQLQLTDDEIQQLDNAFDAAEVRMIELRGNVAVERAKLRALLGQSDLDEAAVVQQHQSEQSARALLSDERFAFLLKARKILGNERFIKLMETRDAQRRNRFMENPEESKPTP